MEVAEVGAPEERNVTRLLLRNEYIRSLLCFLFALHMRCEDLIFHEVKEGPSSETACVEHVLCMCIR